MTVLLVTVMSMNSHSYWVLITSRDHSVASAELACRTRLISSAGSEGKGKFLNRLTKNNVLLTNTTKRVPAFRLTRVDDRFEWEVAALDVEGEFINLHPAGADQHLVVLNLDRTIKLYGEKRTWRGFVLFYPVWWQTEKYILFKRRWELTEA